MSACLHDDAEVEEAISHPDDPLWGYCYGCMQVVQRVSTDTPWVEAEF